MAPWGAFVDAFAFNWAQPKPTTSILGTACLTLDGARCFFPYQLAPHSNHSGCFWRASLEGFQCHVGENETGAPLFGECSSDCPRDCAAGYRKCNSSCIFQDAACGTDCPEGEKHTTAELFTFPKKQQVAQNINKIFSPNPKSPCLLLFCRM